jgi:hypothetical protein
MLHIKRVGMNKEINFTFSLRVERGKGFSKNGRHGV